MKRAGLWLGIVLVGWVVLVAIVALFWTPFDPLRIRPDSRLLPPGWPHLLGTDNYGLDIVSMLMSGSFRWA